MYHKIAALVVIASLGAAGVDPCLPCWGAPTADAPAPDPDPGRLRKEVAAFSKFAPDPSDPRPSLLCIGSSSFRLWDAQAAFPEYEVFNCGFGGSHFSDVNALWPAVAPDVDPQWVLVYEGDNDTAANKSSAQVYGDFREAMGRLLAAYPKAEIVIVPSKPSPARTAVWPVALKLNERMAEFARQRSRVRIVADLPAALLGDNGEPRVEYYVGDRLHLSPAGYAVWTDKIRAAIGLPPLVPR